VFAEVELRVAEIHIWQMGLGAVIGAELFILFKYDTLIKKLQNFET